MARSASALHFPLHADVVFVDQRRRKNLRLQAAINRFLDEHNEKPKPFVWRADPVPVLAAIERGQQALEVGPLDTQRQMNVENI